MALLVVARKGRETLGGGHFLEAIIRICLAN